MTDLVPITALGAQTSATETYGALKITENIGIALASLALRKSASRPSPFGLSLPAAGQAAFRNDVSAFWIGPGQWMIEMPGKAETDFEAAVRLQAPGCSVTEQTDGFTSIEIVSGSGPTKIEALMSKLVNLDPSLFIPGSATRTGLEHMSVFLIRRDNNRLTIIGMRTFGPALWRAITVAARSLNV